jgi:cytoskeletal protein RodZ
MDEKKDIPVTEMASTFQDFKAAREARGLSLQDIFKATRVSLINLTAVESGDFNRLPPPVYARNFIRKYAREVGIDEKQILNHYEKHLESLKPPIEETEIQRPWPETGRQYRFLFGSLAAVIAAGILVSALFLYDQAGKTTSPVPAVESPPPAQVIPAPAQTAAVPVSPAQATAAESAPTAPGSSVQPPAAAGGKMFHLVIEARR